MWTVCWLETKMCNWAVYDCMKAKRFHILHNIPLHARTHTHTGDWLIKLRGVSASAVCAEKLIFGCDHFCVCETSSPGQPEQRSHRPPVEVSRTCTLSHASCKSWVISEQWHWVVLYYRWVFAAVKYLCSVGTLKAFTAQFILPNGFIKSSLNASTSPLGE